MFNDLISKIKLKLAEYRYKRQIDLRVKKFQIRNAVIKYYMDYDRIHNVVDIPAYQRADRVMAKTVKTPADVDRCYRKLLQYEEAIYGG